MRSVKFDWKRTAKEESRELLNIINNLHRREMFHEGTSSLNETFLSFYEKWKLLKATEHSTLPSVSMYFLCSEDKKVIKLNGTEEALTEVNLKASVKLDEVNVLDYVKFFFDAVNAGNGTFQVVEKVDDFLFDEELSIKARQDFDEIVSLAEISSAEEGFKIKTFIVYTEYLYHVIIAVSKDGKVSIEKEEAVYEGLPVRQIILR